MTTQTKYRSRHFELADDLLRALSPVPDLDTNTPNPKFIFRGQADEDWKLVPSALRRGANQDRTDAVRLIASYGLDSTWDNQVFAELQLLRLFMDACDRSVIAVPGDSHEFRKAWMDDQRGEVTAAFRHPSKWPFPAHLSPLAIAQHHGIPTRLLDWTRHAIVAAYFAAQAYARDPKNEGSQSLAIWALNIEMLHLYPQIELIELPGANSQRLGVQRGVFTVVRDQQTRGEMVWATSLEDALVSRDADPSKPKPLWKLTLPKTQALRLLYLCHLNGVDAASIKPGVEGAAQAAIEQLAWLRADSIMGVNATVPRPSAEK